MPENRRIPQLDPLELDAARIVLDQLIAGLPHYDVGTVIDAAIADASDLATSMALANALKVAMNAHFALTTLHAAADGAVSITSANATDLPTAQTLVNEMFTDWNLHLMTGVAVHKVADMGHRGTSATASDQATTNARANELRRSFNAHVLRGSRTLESVAS